MTLTCVLTWAEDRPPAGSDPGAFKIRCPVPFLCLRGPLVALTFIFQPQGPQGLTEVHSEALRSQTLKQFRRCRQVPAGPRLPQRARDGFTRPLGTEATRHSLWAHRLTPRLSTSSLLSWLKHRLPPEAPPAWPAPPGQLPSRLLPQQPVLAPRQDKSIVLHFPYVFCSSPRGQPVLNRTGNEPARPRAAPHPLPLPGCTRVWWYLPLGGVCALRSISVKGRTRRCRQRTGSPIERCGNGQESAGWILGTPIPRPRWQSQRPLRPTHLPWPDAPS